MEFDYLGSSIFINQFNLNKNDNNVHIIINDNDLVVVGDKIEIFCKEIKVYNEANRKMDEFLKNS